MHGASPKTACPLYTSRWHTYYLSLWGSPARRSCDGPEGVGTTAGSTRQVQRSCPPLWARADACRRRVRLARAARSPPMRAICVWSDALCACEWTSPKAASSWTVLAHCVLCVCSRDDEPEHGHGRHGLVHESAGPAHGPARVHAPSLHDDHTKQQLRPATAAATATAAPAHGAHRHGRSPRLQAASAHQGEPIAAPMLLSASGPSC